MAPIKRPRRNTIVKSKITLPKGVSVMSASRKNKSDKKESEKPKIRGAEVSIRESAVSGQIVYGTFKIGGVYTFLETSRRSRAFLRLGTENSMVGVYAKAEGASGNQISIALVVNGVRGSTTVSVTGTVITVNLRSSNGTTTTATAAQVIAAINASEAASALVGADDAEGNGTGVVEPVAETFLQFGGGSWLHQVITLACHDISSIDKIYFDERTVQFQGIPNTHLSTGFYSRIEKDGTTQWLVQKEVRLGDANQTALGSLINQLPSKWTSNHRQRGCAHIYLITIWDEGRFARGLPSISFQVKGKPLYDPRTGWTAYSNNAALVIADYLTNTKFGMGVDWSDIDTAELINAANECDELIPLATGGNERRYEIEGVFDSSQSPQQVLEEMADAIAGDIVYQNGKWRILPGKWRAPTVSLSRGDVIGGLSVATRRSRRDTFNTVRGTIASKEHENEPIDFPAVSVSEYVTEDGKKIYKDLVLNFVTSPSQAQRIAKIRLGQMRQPIVVDVTFTIKAMALQIGDVITYTDDTFGWTNKEFEIRDFSLEIGTGGMISVRVTMVETAELIYTWTTADQLAVDPAPNTNFPKYSDIDPVSNVVLESGTQHLYTRTDGTIFARLKVSWDESPSEFVQRGGSYEIQLKRSGDSTFVPASIVSSETTNVYILDVKDGEQYDVRVRAVSAGGVGSAWVTVSNHLVIGKTAAPSNVPLLSAVVDGFGLLIGWTPIADLDVQEYELRYGAQGVSWESISATAIRVKSNQYFFKTFVAGTHQFQIKAVDTSGNYSITATSTILAVAAPSQVQDYDISQVDNNVLVDWNPPGSSTFPVAFYNVYKGATFVGATLLGKVGGTFFAYVEKTGGAFTYWVTAVDEAGNEGPAVGKTVNVSSPPDYVLIDSRTLLPNDATFVRCLAEPNNTSFLAPVTTGETWTQHFTNNSQTTIQGFIDAGFSIWLQPSPTSASTAEWTYDLGTVLPQNIISIAWTLTALSGTVTVSPTISWRETTGAAWTNGSAGATQVYATNFRYVKVVLTITGDNNLALGRISNVFAKIDTKKQTDAGTAEVSNATNGATVNFNLDFLDVLSIVVTPQGTTSAIIPVVDFNDAPNPTSFTVYLYNKDGTKITGSFRWSAVGIVNNI